MERDSPPLSSHHLSPWRRSGIDDEPPLPSIFTLLPWRCSRHPARPKERKVTIQNRQLFSSFNKHEVKCPFETQEENQGCQVCQEPLPPQEIIWWNLTLQQYPDNKRYPPFISKTIVFMFSGMMPTSQQIDSSFVQWDIKIVYTFVEATARLITLGLRTSCCSLWCSRATELDSELLTKTCRQG